MIQEDPGDAHSASADDDGGPPPAVDPAPSQDPVPEVNSAADTVGDPLVVDPVPAPVPAGDPPAEDPVQGQDPMPKSNLAVGDPLEVDLRDNQLDELSQSVLGSDNVASCGTQDSLADIDMSEFNPRKRSFSAVSSSGSVTPASVETCTYSFVVKGRSPPAPPRRRKRITPAVNVDRVRSRSVNHADSDVSCPDASSSVSPSSS